MFLEKKKNKEKEDEEVPVTPKAGDLSVDYLNLWKNDKKNWKFQKVRQTWLLQHMYDLEKVK